MSRAENRSIGDLLLCLVGPIVWAAHFFSLYLAQSLICTSEAGAGRDARFALIAAAATLMAVLGLLLFLASAFRRAGSADPERGTQNTSQFLLDTSTALAALALLGILWVAWPAFTLQVCTVVAG